MCFLRCLYRMFRTTAVIVLLYLFVGFIIGCLTLGLGGADGFLTVAGWKSIVYTMVSWPFIILAMVIMMKL